MKMPRAVGFFLLAVAGAQAAPVERDLGNGLAYFRAAALPGDLPTLDSAHPRSTVLDLRYAHGDTDASRVLEAWLKVHATPHTPVFVLANADTDAPLRAMLTGRRAAANVVVIGIEADIFHPDIAVRATPEKERAAYDAFEHGVTLQALTSDNPGKPRNDEASLAHDRTPDAANSGELDPDPANPGEKAARAAVAPPPIDAAVQRSVHLHRALLALKKI